MLIRLLLMQDHKLIHGAGMIKDSVQGASTKFNLSIEEISQSHCRKYLTISSSSSVE